MKVQKTKAKGMVSKFREKVIKAVGLVPFGKVASYGQIALMIGIPRAGRQVGQTLRHLEEDMLSKKYDIPWWRIVNNAGRISIKGTKYATPALQKKLLEKEGIKVSTLLTFDIEKYRFRPDPLVLRGLELSDEYIEMIMTKYLV